MTHARTLIRNGIAGTALDTVKGQTGSRTIYRSRYRPVTKYPSISVFNATERVTVENPGYINTSQADKRYRREQDFIIEIAVEKAEDADTALDDLCELVEEAMQVNEQFVAGVIAVDLVSTTFQGSTGQGTEQLQMAQLTYRVLYRTGALDSSTPLS